MQIVARILLGILIAIAAMPAPACMSPVPKTSGMGMAVRDHAPHHRDAPPCHDAGHVCVGCAAPLPDAAQSVPAIGACDAPPPPAFVARRDPAWRPGFDPPPPRQSV